MSNIYFRLQDLGNKDLEKEAFLVAHVYRIGMKKFLINVILNNFIPTNLHIICLNKVGHLDEL